MQPKLVEQYRCEINFANVRISLTGPTRAELEAFARNMLTGKGTIKTEDVQGTTVLYHAAHKQGNEPIGWISQARVPTELSVEHQQKLADAIAA
jgi:hypothetical protein